MRSSQTFTLVCGGGGVWGVAWMTGIVAGLAEAGLDLREAGSFIGTSAGATIAAQLSSGLSSERLYERQADPGRQPAELTPPADGLAILMDMMQRPWTDNGARLRAICDLAVNTETVSPAARIATIRGRLGMADLAWPRKPLSITAVDADSLELCVFSAASGILLLDAVTASSAVPIVWPAVLHNGRRYVDGGVWRTFDNAHLAEGADAVLILSPMGLTMSKPGVKEDVANLQARGARVCLITPDTASQKALEFGPLDPASRQPAAEAGRDQGRRELTVRPDLRGIFEGCGQD